MPPHHTSRWDNEAPRRWFGALSMVTRVSSRAQASSHPLWAKTGWGWGKVKGECGGPAATTYLPSSTPGHLSPLCCCSQVERSVLANGRLHQPRYQCHLSRCQASCNGNPGSVLDENTCPLSASSQALLPASPRASLGPAFSQATEQEVVTAEPLSGKEGAGHRFGGKIQGSGDICCCPVCRGGEYGICCRQ